MQSLVIQSPSVGWITREKVTARRRLSSKSKLVDEFLMRIPTHWRNWFSCSDLRRRKR
jgi:hypothetical protein